MTEVNLSLVLESQLKSAFVKVCDFDPQQLLNVTTSKMRGYTTKNLGGLQKLLKAADHPLKTKSLVEWFHVLTADLDPKKWICEFKNGYINIDITPEHLSHQIQKLILTQSPIFEVDSTQRKKILVDFSSPNIAKDMHVGHLRSTIIGDSIATLYEVQGHKVLRVNHIGDFGLPFGMLIQHFLESYPNHNFNDLYEVKLSISDLQEFYVASKKRFDAEHEFQKQSYQRVVDLQTGEALVTGAWQMIKKISEASYNDIYSRLGIKLTETGESFYQKFIPSLVAELKDKGLLELEEGRQIIRVPGFEVPLTVVKSDGSATYDTTDLAAIRYRLLDLDQDEVYYVVDSGQGLHFDLVFKVAHMAGWVKPHQKIRHIGFGVVLGLDGKKLKSRDGNTIKLVDLLNEGQQKAQEVLDEKFASGNGQSKLSSDQIRDSVAYGSIKYADLSTERTGTYLFSFDKMLSFKGNTGAYQLYEYVRICAILRKAGVTSEEITSHVGELILTEPSELAVCRMLAQFPEVIAKTAETLLFHQLCTYLYDLSTAFSSFHTQCRCLEFNGSEVTKINYSRLLICLATQKIFTSCFQILGLNPIEHM
jgi:arginyl-tRNA synthetase